MLKFQEESLRQSVNGALALRHQINPFLDAIFEKGITNIYFLLPLGLPSAPAAAP